MSQSRFVLKEFGTIALNNDLLSTLNDKLLIDNSPVGNNSISTSSNFTLTTDAGNSLLCSDSQGNITTTGLYFDTDGPLDLNIHTSDYNAGLEFYSNGTSGNTTNGDNYMHMFANNAYLSMEHSNNVAYVRLEAIDDYLQINSTTGTILHSSTSININNPFGNSLLFDDSGVILQNSVGFLQFDLNLHRCELNAASNAIIFRTPNMCYPDSFNSTTQTTSFSTAITPGTGTLFGTLTTLTATTATQGSSTIRINNSIVTSSCIINLTINSYSGTGLPSVRANNITPGQYYDLIITNNSISAPLNAPLTIAFNITKQGL